MVRPMMGGMAGLTNNWHVTLSFANVSGGNPGINLYNSVENNGGIGYLTNASIANLQSTFTITGGSPPAYSISGPGATIGRLTNGVTLVFPASYFTNGGNYYFLFEGSGVGSGELAMTITDGSGNPILQTGLWLDLHDIKDFYEFARATNVTSGLPPSSLISQFQTLKTISTAPGETKQIIVFVHGINNTDFDVQDSTETIYKRLYWSGYNGRLAAFRGVEARRVAGEPERNENAALRPRGKAFALSLPMQFLRLGWQKTPIKKVSFCLAIAGNRGESSGQTTYLTNRCKTKRTHILCRFGYRAFLKTANFLARYKQSAARRSLAYCWYGRFAVPQERVR